MDGISSSHNGVSRLSTGFSDGHPPSNENENNSANNQNMAGFEWIPKIEGDTDKDKESDLESRRDSGMEDEELQEEDKIPGEGKRSPVGGVSSSRGSASCLPTGSINGCPPHTDRPIEANEKLPNPERATKSRAISRYIQLPTPKNLDGSGRSFLRCSLMSAKFRTGSSEGSEVMDLTDIYSNTGLIDEELFLSSYPKATTHPWVTNLTGVGEKTTVGWAVVPIYVDCTDSNSLTVNVEFDVELHIVKNFPAGLLIGLDAILDYDIDISMGHREASIIDPVTGDPLTLPLFCPPHRKFQNVVIKASERVVIREQQTYAIGFKSAMLLNMDYFFKPWLTAP